MNIVTKVEKFMNKHITFREQQNSLPLALWAIATHTFYTFDYFPYLLITKPVKRCGGTRTMEITSMIAMNSEQYSADSTASMFRDLMAAKDEAFMPTMFIDEAEKLAKEDHPAREFLNKGYKRGQFITKVYGNKVVKIPCYSPKCFTLIGGVYDTLKDRSVVVILRRRTPAETMREMGDTPYRSKDVEAEAAPLKREVSEVIAENRDEIEESYSKQSRLSFLNDRDEEIWSPLFAIARVLCPERVQELTRCAVDMATEKQIDLGRPTEKAEEEANNREYGVILLRDMLALTEGKKYILSRDLLRELYDIPTAPWRKYNGTGLTYQDVGNLLDPLHVERQVIRIGNPAHVKKGEVTTARGYRRDHLKAAWKLAGSRVEKPGNTVTDFPEEE